MTAPPPRRNKAGRRLLLGAGIALILGGLVAVGLFVNTVWLSGNDTDAAQEQLAADFEQSQAAASTSTTTTTAPIEDNPVITAGTVPDEGDLPSTTTTTIPAAVAEEPPAQGAPVGRILIPAIGVDWVIVEGVTLDDLARGPGHMPGTPLPGQPGNAVISGHRTTHGAPFFRVNELSPGDRITIETLIGTHVYEVAELHIVAPNAIWVTGRAEGAWLTLTSCNPPYRSIERLVVFARLIYGPNLEAVEASLEGEPAPPQPPEG